MVGKASKNIRFKEPLIQRFMVATPLPTIRDQRTLTGWVTPATENNSPASAGLFIWKGCDMKKYYPVDFDEKGNAVLGNAKDTPTSNGFISTTWTPGGGSEDEGNGIKSITISPAIATTPALASVFPIYYEDLTEEQKQEGLDVTLTAPNLPAGEYTVTVIPTDEWYARVGETTGTEKGEPVSEQFTINSGAPMALLPNIIAFSNIPDGGEPDQYIAVAIAINKQ